MEDLRSDPLLARNSQVEGYILLPPCVLFSRIGTGGMGAVYRGHHLNLDIEVAVKCLKPSLVDDDPTFVERFKREARSAARINHQNVIRVFDVAESQGLNYLIMEFVQGETARQRVERKRTLSIPEALEIVYESSLGLGEAHRIGIVHRDIKPDNLLVSVRGQVKVADLGLAKPSIGGGQSVLSMAGQVMGTPPYMPPEQWGDGPITPAADVWAMGAVLYYLLAGEEAIYADSVAAIMTKIVTRDFPDVRELRPDVPDDVVALLQRATARDPLDRFADACDLADAIAALPEHRISLVDNDAGTTELRTMLSPPPIPQIAEIKRLFSEGRITRPSVDERPAAPSTAKPPTATATAARRGGVSMLAVVLFVLVIGGGAAGIAWRAGWFAPGRAEPGPGGLAQVLQLVNAGRPVAALRAARALAADDPAALPAGELDRLRARATSLLEAQFTLAEVAEVVRGRSARFAGRYRGDLIETLVVDGREVAIEGGAFSVEATPATGRLAVAARVTADDLLPVGSWTFRVVDPPAIAFVGALGTRPPLGERDAVGVRSIKVFGRTNEAGAEIRLADDVLGRAGADGSFEVTVALPVEGRNELQLAAGREGEPATASESLTVVRLVEQPELRVVAPTERIFGTDRERLTLTFEVGEWTRQASATIGGEPLPLRRSEDRFTASVPLVAGRNDIDIEVVDIVGNRTRESLRVTYTAPPLPPPKITAVTLSVGGREVPVLAAERKIVAKSAKLTFASDVADARLLVDGRSRTAPYELPLVEGEFTTFRIEATRAQRRSEPFVFEVALDTTPPKLTAQPVAAVAPGATVVVRGTWNEQVAIDAIRIRGGAAAVLTGKGERTGAWSVSVQAAAQTRTFAVIARDVAGNESDPVEVEVPVVVAEQPKVEQPGPSATALAETIDRAVFTPVGALNQLGYPPRLRHRSGVELLAIGFRDDRKPTLYAAVAMVTVGQWDGGGGDDRKTGIDGRTILRQLPTRLPKLDLPTAADWDRLVDADGIEDTRAGGYREWLRPDKLTATTWPIRKDNSGVTTARDNESSRYRGFRVVFRP